MQPDPSTPRFVISLLNRAAGGSACAQYETHQVPQRGDLICAHGGSYTKGTPFQDQYHWRVDEVVWNVAAPGSYDATEWVVRRRLGSGNGFCTSVDLLVWPAQGPHWVGDQPWMHLPPGDDEGDPDGA